MLQARPVNSNIEQYIFFQIEVAEVSIQDDGGDPDLATVENHHLQNNRQHLTPVPEAAEAQLATFKENYDIADENIWV